MDVALFIGFPLCCTQSYQCGHDTFNSWNSGTLTLRSRLLGGNTRLARLIPRTRARPSNSRSISYTPAPASHLYLASHVSSLVHIPTTRSEPATHAMPYPSNIRASNVVSPASLGLKNNNLNLWVFGIDEGTWWPHHRMWGVTRVVSNMKVTGVIIGNFERNS